jgi:hypothetical protein
MQRTFLIYSFSIQIGLRGPFSQLESSQTLTNTLFQIHMPLKQESVSKGL